MGIENQGSAEEILMKRESWSDTEDISRVG